MCDQITSDRRFKHAWSNCILRIPHILSGSPNECWLHTWRMRNNNVEDCGLLLSHANITLHIFVANGENVFINQDFVIIFYFLMTSEFIITRRYFRRNNISGWSLLTLQATISTYKFSKPISIHLPQELVERIW